MRIPTQQPNDFTYSFQAGGAGRPQKVNLVAYIDATDRYMEGGFVAKLKNFEDIKSRCGENFQGAAMVNRAGLQTFSGSRDEPVWKGKRKFLISPSITRKIDSVPLKENVEDGDSNSPPSPEELGEFFGKNMRPFKTNIVYFTGHGGGHAMGEISTRQMSQALETAREISGEKPRILFFEACVMGHLDGLRAFQGKADVALVTEETIPQDALPLSQMLEQVCLKSGTSEEIAKAMIQAASGKSGVRTFAAVNLEKIEILGKAVDHLKELLVPELETKEGMKKIREAVKQSYYCLPRGREYGFGDLGEFLKSLEKKEFAPEIQEAVSVAQKCLGKTVIAKITEPDYYGVSGLSFDTSIGNVRFTWQNLIFD